MGPVGAGKDEFVVVVMVPASLEARGYVTYLSIFQYPLGVTWVRAGPVSNLPAKVRQACLLAGEYSGTLRITGRQLAFAN